LSFDHNVHIRKRRERRRIGHHSCNEFLSMCCCHTGNQVHQYQNIPHYGFVSVRISCLYGGNFFSNVERSPISKSLKSNPGATVQLHSTYSLSGGSNAPNHEPAGIMCWSCSPLLMSRPSRKVLLPSLSRTIISRHWPS